MKDLGSIVIFWALLLIIFFCRKQKGDYFKIQQLTPWCIVNFDVLERSPAERMAMLKEMGFKSYGYNWDERHLTSMREEFRLAKDNDITIKSVFLWLNAKRDSIGKLSPRNEKMLAVLKEVEDKPVLWLSFSDNFFKGLSQEASMSIAIEFIEFIKGRADEIGCDLALYNHHGWFGHPYNQVEIIEALPQDSLKMVYNFHHAHHYLDEFPQIAKRITPYLSYVNLNGMKNDGPQILTIGDGDHEFEMINILLEEGYNGPWGILGHIKTEDVQKVLERNIKGLQSFNSKFK